MHVTSIAECLDLSAILLTFIKLTFVIKIFLLSILSGRTVFCCILQNSYLIKLGFRVQS